MKILLNVLLVGGFVLSLAACGGGDDSSSKKEPSKDKIPSLAFDSSLSHITSVNSSAYPVSGSCNPSGGDVKVVIGTPNVIGIFPCSEDGQFSGEMDLSRVELNPPEINASQGTKTAESPPTDLVNDQIGPESPSVTTATGDVLGGDLPHNLEVSCSEVGEIIIVTGSGLDPNPQTHTCIGSGAQSIELSLEPGADLSSPNDLAVSSTDQYGNPASGTTTVIDVPVDTQAPIVSITNSGTMTQGQVATFSVNITDTNIDTNSASFSYNFNVSSGTAAPTSCTANPCVVTVTGASAGPLTFTVAADAIADDVGNAVGDALTSELMVNEAGALSFNEPFPKFNLINRANYPVSGSCDATAGNVVISHSGSTSDIPCETPGHFNITVDLSAASTLEISAMQGTGPSVSPDSKPVSDVDPIASAPVVEDQDLTNAKSLTLDVTCTEIGEVLTFTGTGLRPNQTHACVSEASPETVILSFLNSVETGDTNSITLSSLDANGNETTSPTDFNLPIDNKAPVAVITNIGNIAEGSQATFTIDVTDENIENLSYDVFINQGTVRFFTCEDNPCVVTVSGATLGTLTLTVSANEIEDDAGNTNIGQVSDSLEVQVSALTANAPAANTQNAATYPVSGNCDASRRSGDNYCG